jgi:putative MFS transporter
MAQTSAATLSTVAQIAARIDRLPPCRPLWAWVARISFGAFFEIYETALTSLLAPLLVRSGVFHKDRGGLFGLPDLATFGFATFTGLFIGALVFSAVSDRVGRRPIFTYSLIWYAVATLFMGMQPDALWICSWRLIAAIGVGAEIVAVDSYISEMLPKSMRGRGFAISKALQYTAVPVAGILAALLANKTVGSLQGWQVMLVVPAVGAMLIWWVRRGLPESPRWLAGRGRLAAADTILRDIETRITRRIGVPLPPPDRTVPAASETQLAYVDLLRAPLLRRTIMLTIVSCATTIAYFGFGNWLPSLLEERGVTVAKSLAYTAIIAFSYPLTPFLVSFIADRSERKWQIVCGAAIVAVAGLSFAAQGSVAGWITCGLLVTIGNNITSYATHTYRSELFPTNVRARGIGLVYSIDRIAAAFNSYLIGFILLEGGATAVLVTISAACLVAIVTVASFGPRTRGVAADYVPSNSATA